MSKLVLTSIAVVLGLTFIQPAVNASVNEKPLSLKQEAKRGVNFKAAGTRPTAPSFLTAAYCSADCGNGSYCEAWGPGASCGDGAGCEASDGFGGIGVTCGGIFYIY